MTSTANKQQYLQIHHIEARISPSGFPVNFRSIKLFKPKSRTSIADGDSSQTVDLKDEYIRELERSFHIRDATIRFFEKTITQHLPKGFPSLRPSQSQQFQQQQTTVQRWSQEVPGLPVHGWVRSQIW